MLTCETRCYLRGVLSNCQKVLEDSMFFCFWLQQSALLMSHVGPAGSWRPGFVKGYPNPNQEHHQRWNPWSTDVKISVWHEISAWLSVLRFCQPLIEGVGTYLFPVMCWAQSLERIRRHVLNAQWQRPLIAMEQIHSQETVAAMNLISAQLSPPWPCELE